MTSSDICHLRCKQICADEKYCFERDQSPERDLLEENVAESDGTLKQVEIVITGLILD